MHKIRRALISVYDKRGIVPFAKALRAQGLEILSTGGTLSHLRRSKVKVTSVSAVTGFPEILGGRVKTLHPNIHGGLLYVRESEAHRKEVKKHGIRPIDLVVVNLYPFTEVIKKKGISLKKALENIDIGGPTMLHSAAKNFLSVAVVCDPGDYQTVLIYMKKYKGKLPHAYLKELATKVFSLTSYYDAAIQEYLGAAPSDMPHYINRAYEKMLPLRYGENPHQKGAFYKKRGVDLAIRQLHGKEVSYNNIMDFYTALAIISEFKQPAAAVIKHNNPCGIAENRSLLAAIEKSIASDPLSAFGGIVVVNRPIDKAGAALTCERLGFFEMIIAPRFTAAGLSVLKERKNLRIIEIGNVDTLRRKEKYVYTFLDGGLLVQERDGIIDDDMPRVKKDLKVVSKRKPSSGDIQELLFAWKCAKMVKSNAIVLTKNKATVGIGAGQMSRVDAMLVACRKAGERSKDSYIASDGFFPKADNIDVAARSGVKAIIQPGGSIRDAEVINAVNKHKVMMLCTGRRHFRH